MARSSNQQRQYVIDKYPTMWQGFQSMRGAIRELGPLDLKTQELINTVAYATADAEGGTKTHATRAYEAGASLAELEQALLLCLGVGMGFAHTYRAIEWVRAALEEAGARVE
jgi:alkylhydroperoxidase/carboxymuconolactone decarboxylase family protein YurZ